MRRFTAGDRVTATLWGQVRCGAVMQDNGNGIVWVRWDNGLPRLGWTHASSLSPEGK